MLYHARMVVDERLHLPDLLIENFRGIESLTLPRLGHVTLLTGKNGVGKSTVLEAVQLYATRGRSTQGLLMERGETFLTTDVEDDEVAVPDGTGLFHKWDASPGTKGMIGSSSMEDKALVIEPYIQAPEYEKMKKFLNLSQDRILAIKFSFGDQSWHSYGMDDALPMIQGSRLGPSVLNDTQLAKMWGEVALSPEQSKAVAALEIATNTSIEGVALVNKEQIAVRLKEHDHRIPLRGLGDGAVRLFGVALALAVSRDGFLLIDEAENGIHHSIQRDYWRMVLQAAHDNNVQVIATTHSGDCVRAFAQEAVDNDTVDGVLFRLEKDDDGIYPIKYSEEDLKVCAEQGIEVR